MHPNISITRRSCRSLIFAPQSVRAAVLRIARDRAVGHRSDARVRPRRIIGFFGAPVGLIISIDRRLQVGSWLDLGMFIQNVMIAAGARGLQTCPQETFSKYHALLGALLPIPPEEMVVCGMSVGFAEDESVSSRKPDAKGCRRRICSIHWFRGLSTTETVKSEDDGTSRRTHPA